MSERIAFQHVDGPRRGETDDVLRLPAAVGAEAGVDVVVPGAAPRHFTLLRRGPDVVLRDAGTQEGTFLAGEPVHEAVLRDGDVVELGAGGPRLLFRHEGAAPLTLLQTLRRPRPELPRDHRRLLHRMRQNLAQTSLAFRVTAALALVAGAGLLFWRWEASRRLDAELAMLREAVRQGEEERRRFEERIEQERKRAGSLEAQIAQFKEREEELSTRLKDAASGEVQTLKDELSLTRGRLETLEGEREAGERIIRDYGAGVCLVQAAYAFYDSSGHPLRYRVDEAGRTVRDENGNPDYTTEGSGPIHTVSFFGTAFLVDRRGLVLTNRHVAEPWWNDGAAEALAGAGYKPRFTLFRAFFPREDEPFELDVARRSEKVDLALLRIEMRGRKIPALPLDGEGTGAVPGQPVVVVGYPTGLEAILAKADTSVVQEILDAHGTSSERVTEALAHKGLIRPSTTQGHIGDVTPTDIVFDAPTTQGGSGAPVFNKYGRVIAVEYAVLPKFGGNSFGIPMRYALDLLAEARKKGRGD